MAESNRAEHQHKVEETPSEAILRHNKPWRKPWLKQRNSD